MKKANTIKILEAMDNWQILSNIDLNNIAGWRFWWYLYQLRKDWVVFEKTKWIWYIEFWKIVSIPKTLEYKNRNSIKNTSISNTKKDKWYNKLFKF